MPRPSSRQDVSRDPEGFSRWIIVQRLFFYLLPLPPRRPGVVARAHGEVRAGGFLTGAVEFGIVGDFVAFARYGVGEYDFGKCVEVEVLVAAECEVHRTCVGVDVPVCAALFAAFDVEYGLDLGDVIAVSEVFFNACPRLCI